MQNFGMEWQDSGSLIDVFFLDIDSANRVQSYCMDRETGIVQILDSESE